MTTRHARYLSNPLAIAIAATLLSSCAPDRGEPEAVASTAIPVEIVKVGDGYQLLRGGEPFEVKGAGIEFGNVEALAAHGGNSFRTWRTDNGRATGQEVLDRALAAGVTVAMCIEIARERHGFDYNDDEAVRAQFEYARGEVEKYKDHPALLAWIIGNEPNLYYENPRVFDAINDISKMIHEVDGQHPTTTALAGFSKELGEVLAERAPDLDFLSVQFYGDIVNLPRYIDEAGYEGPYWVTEWGAIGHWEVDKTAWGAPIEQHSSDKADNYLKSYREVIAPDTEAGLALGSYVFLWGQKQERTPTWYGMFLDTGEETETVDVMHYIWNGSWPDNRSPQVATMTLNGGTAHDSVTLAPGTSYPAMFDVSDPDGDPLRTRWEVRPESQATQTGGDKEEVPPVLPGLVSAGDGGNATLTTPSEPGAYRLFAYAYDDANNAAHANIPFLVEAGTGAD